MLLASSRIALEHSLELHHFNPSVAVNTSLLPHAFLKCDYSNYRHLMQGGTITKVFNYKIKKKLKLLLHL